MEADCNTITHPSYHGRLRAVGRFDHRFIVVRCFVLYFARGARWLAARIPPMATHGARGCDVIIAIIIVVGTEREESMGGWCQDGVNNGAQWPTKPHSEAARRGIFQYLSVAVELVAVEFCVQPPRSCCCHSLPK